MEFSIASQDEGGQRMTVSGVEASDLKAPTRELTAFLQHAGSVATLSSCLTARVGTSRRDRSYIRLHRRG